MGFFESALGLVVIPGTLIILALLANGTGRRQLNKIILTVIGIEIKVSGYGFKLMNILTFINLAYVFASLAKIQRLHSIHEAEAQQHTGDGVFQTAHYIQEVYATYRTMLMNLCSVVLTLCLTIATEQYEYYKPVKDQAERL